MKKTLVTVGIAAFTGLAAWGISLAYGDYSREQARSKQRERTSIEAAEFANCATSQLSKDGLRETAIYQFQPSGILWEQMRSTVPVLASVPPPRDRFSSSGDTGLFQWAAFDGLRTRCRAENFNFNDDFRWAFWDAMTKQPAYQRVVEEVRAENDAIMKPFREKDHAAAEGRAKADAARQAPLFRDTAQKN